MTKLLMFVLVAALAVTPALFGQATPGPGQTQPKGGQSQQQADRAGESTVTGCLTESAGMYKLATTAGQQIEVKAGTEDLTKHKDHTVRLTGKQSDEGGKTSLMVSKVEHVAATCTK